MRGSVDDLRRRIAELEASNAAAAADVRYLAAMERIGRISRAAVDLDSLLEGVLDELLAMFSCDRAWLLFPCDPAAPAWSVPKERTVPAWPGAFALGVQVPMEEGAAAVFVEALAAPGSLPYDATTERSVPEETARAFGVRSQIVVALRPHAGQPWLLGLHHCQAEHVWTAEEQRIFEGAAARAADALDALTLQRELRQREAEVIELQRSEALGSIAGGVAHDFNNQLLVILCYSEMLREQVGGQQGEHLDHVVGAAEQAADLTRQLLAFSRRAVLEPRPVELGEAVEQVTEFLARAVGPSIELRTRVGPDPVIALVDPAQLEQVLVNLVINARDAMSGGVVSVSTSLCDGADGPEELHPGRYAVLEVQDDGPGMSPETLGRVFEPFFTTKERGKGTGLGLSTAYGVARQSGGTLTARSVLGEGATFALWLPESSSDPSESSGGHAAVQADGGSERILLVDPEPRVIEVAARVLRGRGYRVEGVSDADAALKELGRPDLRYDLLLTELALPREDGVSLIERALKLHPSLRASFCTGFSPPVIERLRTSGATRRILQKPFTPERLLKHVRYLLDR